MRIPERKDCEHSPVCKYDDDMCPIECGHFVERSDNRDYATAFKEALSIQKENYGWSMSTHIAMMNWAAKWGSLNHFKS